MPISLSPSLSLSLSLSPSLSLFISLLLVFSPQASAHIESSCLSLCLSPRPRVCMHEYTHTYTYARARVYVCVCVCIYISRSPAIRHNRRTWRRARVLLSCLKDTLETFSHPPLTSISFSSDSPPTTVACRAASIPFVTNTAISVLPWIFQAPSCRRLLCIRARGQATDERNFRSRPPLVVFVCFLLVGVSSYVCVYCVRTYVSTLCYVGRCSRYVQHVLVYDPKVTSSFVAERKARGLVLKYWIDTFIELYPLPNKIN